MINDVDKFRHEFFDKLVKEEKQKEREVLRIQKNCFHKYNEKNQELLCSKCGHIINKIINTGTDSNHKNTQNSKMEGCVIA
jgi:hypothetical protein